MSYASFAHATFDNMLETLDALAEKAMAAGMKEEVLATRLVDDMFPLELQFRVAINQPLLALQQVGGTDVQLEQEPFPTFAKVRERIAAVRKQLAAIEPDRWAPDVARVDLTLPNGVRFMMSAEEDVRDWLLPNLYFHVSMAYALLRRAGLEIGKMNFLPHMTRHIVTID